MQNTFPYSPSAVNREAIAFPTVGYSAVSRTVLLPEKLYLHCIRSCNSLWSFPHQPLLRRTTRIQLLEAAQYILGASAVSGCRQTFCELCAGIHDVSFGRARWCLVLTLTRGFPVFPHPSAPMATVLYSVKILRWLEANPLLADKVFEGVVRVITLTGDRTGASRKADVLFKDRHWESIRRINCRGR